ncbi:discoidin domain-containing protein [Gluconobacter sp.]|uniref:discoidin domain-containing protein n=1 Tax=Gluconobacter sp. TaxID=1876758 RepID=UPI0039EB1E13
MAHKAKENSYGGDFVIAADFTGGAFPTPGFECIGHTQTEIAELGFPIIPRDRALWHNWDYICPVILSWEKQKYDYYVVTESDVSANMEFSRLCEKMAEEGIDLIVDFIHKPTPEWMWYNDAVSVSDDPLGCLLCVSIFSHRALELITERRLELAAEHAAGIRTNWPFCETVVPATIRDAGLKIADLQDFADLHNFHFERKYSEHNPVVNVPGSFVHSVVSGKKIISLALASRPTRTFIDNPLDDEAAFRYENRRDVQKAILDKSLREPDHTASAILSRIYEIDIYSTQDPAAHKPVATSSLSDYSRSDIPAEADNLTNPRWEGEFAFHTGYESHPWVVIDLLEETFLRSLTIRNRETYSERFEHFTIETSLDSESWRTEVFDLSIDSDKKVNFVTFKVPSLGRFLRITSLSKGCLHLRSLRAEPLELGPLQNLAIYASAEMSSISAYSRGQDKCSEAALLFLGSDDYSIHSENEPCPWWKADFDRLVVIDQIRILTRPGWRNRFIRFAFETSADGEHWNVMRLVLDGQSPSAAPADEIVWQPKQAFATRHLRIRLLENGVLNLRQIEILGRPAV